MELLADSLSAMFRKYRADRMEQFKKAEQLEDAAGHTSTVAGLGPGTGEGRGQGREWLLPPAALEEEGRFCRSGLTPTQAAFFGRQMVSALQSVHELGYVHRDVKPANFAMGRRPGSIGVCYVIDFGLARKYTHADGVQHPRSLSTSASKVPSPALSIVLCCNVMPWVARPLGAEPPAATARGWVPRDCPLCEPAGPPAGDKT